MIFIDQTFIGQCLDVHHQLHMAPTFKIPNRNQFWHAAVQEKQTHIFLKANIIETEIKFLLCLIHIILHPAALEISKIVHPLTANLKSKICNSNYAF